MLISSSENIFTETPGRMFDQISGHRDPAKLTQKINHCNQSDLNLSISFFRLRSQPIGMVGTWKTTSGNKKMHFPYPLMTTPRNLFFPMLTTDLLMSCTHVVARSSWDQQFYVEMTSTLKTSLDSRNCLDV